METENQPLEKPAGRGASRNTNSLIRQADRHFDAAHFQGLMAIYGPPLSGAHR
ncbi:hypothetical protein J2Z50_003024 [Ensifer mexicanus]|nr:hypothetical protein [Sinorhizobium mexicanum]